MSDIGSTNPIPQHFEVKEFTPYPECQGNQNSVGSTKTVAAYSGPIQDYGLFGLRKFRPSWPLVDMFRRTHCGGVFQIVNNSWLIEKNILFQPWGKIDIFLKFNSHFKAIISSPFLSSSCMGRFELFQWCGCHREKESSQTELLQLQENLRKRRQRPIRVAQR